MIKLEDADAILRDYYLGAVSAQLNGEGSPFFNAIEKSSDNVSGRYAYYAFSSGNLGGVAAVGETDDLPSPHDDMYLEANVELKNLYGTMQITDKAIKASSNVSGTFLNVLNTEMEGLIAAAKANLARMLYGDSDGYICTVTSKQSDTVLVVDNAKQFFEGYAIMIDHADDAINTTIKSVDVNAGTITVTTSLADKTFEGNEKIYIQGAEEKELTGLAGIFEYDSLYGRSKNAFKFLKPIVETYERASLTEENLIDMIDKIEEIGGNKADMILCSFKTRKKIASLMSASRRIVNTTDINAGYSSIIVNDVPVYADKFCPENRIYFLNSADFVLCQLCDWSWLEGDGGKILHQIPGKAAYSATLVKYAELICKKPCGQGLIMLT